MHFVYNDLFTESGHMKFSNCALVLFFPFNYYFECLFLCDLAVELSVGICIETLISPNNLLKFGLGSSSLIVGE